MFKRIVSFLLIFFLSSICFHDTGIAFSTNEIQNSCILSHCIDGNGETKGPIDLCLINFEIKRESGYQKSKVAKKELKSSLSIFPGIQKESNLGFLIKKQHIKRIEFFDTQRYVNLVGIVKHIK